MVHEGKEEPPFWDALGGAEEYYKGPRQDVKPFCRF